MNTIRNETYNVDNIDSKMYTYKQTIIQNEYNQPIYDSREDEDDIQKSIIDDSIRERILNEKKFKTMIDIQILKVEDVDGKLYKHLIDSGANKGLTKYRHLLKNYRRIKQIPVNGIGENGAACYIIGVGYFDMETTDGSYISCKMYHAPECSITVISPNAIVGGS